MYRLHRMVALMSELCAGLFTIAECKAEWKLRLGKGISEEAARAASVPEEKDESAGDHSGTD